MKWFLIYINMIAPYCGGPDCGINPAYRSVPNELRVEMPSLETCREVRHVNPGSKCIGEQIEEEPGQKSGSIGSSGVLSGPLTINPVIIGK